MKPAALSEANVTLPDETSVCVTRTFQAPRALVYKAFTTPTLVQRWLLGPPGWSMPVCEMDVRAGGKYRWRWRNDDDQSEFGFHGEYVTVDAPSTIVHSETFDPGTLGGDMGEPAMVTLTLNDSNGVTTMTVVIDYGSQESRDAAMATGMTDGMETSYKLLDQLLETEA